MIFAHGDVKPIMITGSLSPLTISNLVIHVCIISISHDTQSKSKVQQRVLFRSERKTSQTKFSKYLQTCAYAGTEHITFAPMVSGGTALDPEPTLHC